MKAALKWRTDEAGIVVGASTHDGKLTDFSYTAKARSIVIGIENTAHERITLKMTGVAECSFVDVWEWSIPSEIFVWKIAEVPEVCWAIPDSGWNALWARRLPGDARKQAERLARERPDDLLVQIGLANAGWITASCEKVRFYGPSLHGP